MEPLISICLPNLNTRQYLPARMESLLNQTYENWEIIIVDNFSNDGAWEYFQKYASDERIHLSQAPREGMYANWNNCLRKARGEYVYIATSDDTMEPECLEKMVGALHAAQTIDPPSLKLRRPSRRPQTTDLPMGSADVNHEDSKALRSRESNVQSLKSNRRPVDLCVCGFDVIDGDGNVLPEHPAGRWARKFYGEWMTVPHIRDGRTVFLLHAALGMIWWTITSVLFRRTLLDRVGMFRTDRGSQGDEEWEMRAALASDMVYVPENLATWRVSSEQATSNLPSMNRTNLACLLSVLNDPNAGIPQEWKQQKGWKDHISRVCRTEYRDSLGLYRNVAKEKPGNFARGVWKAMKHEPRFLVEQALRGFTFSKDRMSPDPVAAAHELIEMFDAPWPPSRVS